MVAKRRMTKRITLKKKYMIEKKVKAHKRKQKKLKRKQPELFKKKKDPGVPKSLPFYKEVIEEAQREKEFASQNARENAILRQEIIDQERLQDMAEKAIKRAEEFELKQAQIKAETDGLTDKSAKKYYREFKKVVEAADVLLQVLDARDPMGCRVPQMEEMIRSTGKKLVLVLNKVDLVPRKNVENWLKFLRLEYPTVLFKAGTQKQMKHLGRNLANSTSKLLKKGEEELTSAKSLGADILMQLLKNYCRNKNIKTAITVGVVGLPNVGKSSLINSLKRAKTCHVGGTPGVTKIMQDVHLDSKINLLDCPGIILPGGDSNDAMAVLKNAVKIEQLEDPIEAVRAIYESGNKEQLRKLYWTGKTSSLEEFLSKLGKRLGKLAKGGIPSRELAARKILKDWTSGVIKYYTEPPLLDEFSVKASLKTQLSKEFDLSSVYDATTDEVRKLKSHIEFDRLEIATSGPVKEMKKDDGVEEMEDDGQMEQMERIEEDGVEYEDEEEDDEDDDEMETDNQAEERVLPKNLRITAEVKEEEPAAPAEKKPRWENPIQPFDPETMSLKKFSKKMQKKQRKEHSRNEKRAGELTDLFESFSGISEKKDEAYDFNEFF